MIITCRKNSNVLIQNKCNLLLVFYDMYACVRARTCVCVRAVDHTSIFGAYTCDYRVVAMISLRITRHVPVVLWNCGVNELTACP